MHATEDAHSAFYKLANRYLTGEASGRERQLMVEQLKNPELKTMFEEMRSSWDLDPLEPEYRYDVEAAAGRLAAITGRKPTARGASASVFWNRCRRGWRPALLAACLAVSAGILFVGLQKAPPHAMAGGVSWVERTTGSAERLAVTLRDGTKITLNANGALVYPDDFSPYARVVKLSGEAFFDVARDAARPFVVETDSLRITVLGTRFNVRAFGDGTKPEVSIVQGRVQVSGLVAGGESAPTVLIPGQQYTFSPETGEAEVRTVPAEAATRWMQGPLQWEREPLPSALRALEKRFGVSFATTDARLEKETITARFDTESLEEIVEVLQMLGALDLRVERKGGGIVRVGVAPDRLNERPRKEAGH